MFANVSQTDGTLVDPKAIDIALLLVGVLVSVAAVWLQWLQFKKNCPPSPTKHLTRPPFGETSAYNRWRNLYWREVRATLAFAMISLVMVGFILILYSEITLVSICGLIFWIGMFFYNLWVAQWYAWRIATKRKR